MIRSRRNRVTVLTIWALLVCLGFFMFQRGQDTNKSNFLDKLEESKWLELELKKEQVAAGSGTEKNHPLTNKPGEPFNPEKEYTEILSGAPIVIFSKSYCPHSKFVKDILLNEYQINPIPTVVEFDLHPHGAELQAHIGKITGRKTVPNVHVLTVSRGGGDEFRALQAEGTLTSKMKEWAGNKVMIEKNV